MPTALWLLTHLAKKSGTGERRRAFAEEFLDGGQVRRSNQNNVGTVSKPIMYVKEESSALKQRLDNRGVLKTESRNGDERRAFSRQ